MSRDVFKVGPPAYVEYAVGLVLVIGSAAVTGHWLLAVAVVSVVTLLRLLSWLVNRRSNGVPAAI